MVYSGAVGLMALLLLTVALLFLYFSSAMANWISTVSGFSNKRLVVGVRLSAILLLLPLFFNNRPLLHEKAFKLTVLDVGQASAAVLQTRKHTIIVDAGARFSDRLDAGRNIVVPFLRHQGIKSVDYLIITHGDNDHIGGAKAILAAFPETAVIGQGVETLGSGKNLLCTEGMNWQWDGVNFRFISPPADIGHYNKRNNRSCVLQVSSSAGSVLFTADIEKEAERALFKQYGDRLKSAVLLVPHHGSKTSSSADFVLAVDPKISIFSVGYRNKHHFPNKKVKKFYKTLNSRLLQTDKTGAITLSFLPDEAISVELYRNKAGKYWHSFY